MSIHYKKGHLLKDTGEKAHIIAKRIYRNLYANCRSLQAKVFGIFSSHIINFLYFTDLPGLSSPGREGVAT